MQDNINLPKHYARFKIEPVRFISENKLDWFQGNVVKYVCRHDAKNGIEDLKKAKRYLEMYIKYLEGNEDFWKSDEAPVEPQTNPFSWSGAQVGKKTPNTPFYDFFASDVYCESATRTRAHSDEDPVFYTMGEGCEWLKWTPEVKFTFAKRYANGDIWDRIVGWR